VQVPAEEAAEAKEFLEKSEPVEEPGEDEAS
jgi:hypothetical protein